MIYELPQLIKEEKAISLVSDCSLLLVVGMSKLRALCAADGTNVMRCVHSWFNTTEFCRTLLEIHIFN